MMQNTSNSTKIYFRPKNSSAQGVTNIVNMLETDENLQALTVKLTLRELRQTGHSSEGPGRNPPSHSSVCIQHHGGSGHLAGDRNCKNMWVWCQYRLTPETDGDAPEEGGA
ncbi:hypothetical protein AAFF_G00026550 [Aldrovandia affinis]|uniref:Uncharacterized protein n=1 Tax=Aldrovandia affinis TaxID=143900 RepID=A0AAD7S585_9TELE|nr:hypothetical protein AAFF_G00026550 [Aldrovandia affinis]